MKRRLGIFLMITLLPAALAGCGDSTPGKGSPPIVTMKRPIANLAAESFTSCDELHQWNASKSDAYNSEMEKYYHWTAENGGLSLPMAAAAQSTSASASSTNIQEAGVDEPDIVKTDGVTIFFARTSSVEIVDAKSLMLKQTLDFPALHNLKLFLDDGRLVVLGRHEFVYGLEQSSYHELRVYKTGSKVELEYEHSFAGEMIDARLSNGQILLVSQTYNGISTPLAIQDILALGKR